MIKPHCSALNRLLSCSHMREYPLRERGVVENVKPDHDEQLHAELLFEDLIGGTPWESTHAEDLCDRDGNTFHYDKRYAIEYLLRSMIKRAGWKISEDHIFDAENGTDSHPMGSFEAIVYKSLLAQSPSTSEPFFDADATDGELVLSFTYEITTIDDQLLLTISNIAAVSTEAPDSVTERTPSITSLTFPSRTYSYQIHPNVRRRAEDAIASRKQEKERFQDALRHVRARALAHQNANGTPWELSYSQYASDQDMRKLVTWPTQAHYARVIVPVAEVQRVGLAFFFDNGSMVDYYEFTLN